MKKILFGLLFIVLIVSLSRSLKTTPPQIIFSNSTAFDFGILDEGKSISHEFEFCNSGEDDLHIKNVKASCGCTKAFVSSEIIPSGSKAIVNISYKARAEMKREIIKVWVESNDPKRPLSELTLMGNIRRRINAIPKSISFYTKHGERYLPKTVKFRTDFPDELIIKDVETSSKLINAEYIKAENLHSCKIGLNSNCPKGNFTEKVIVRAFVGEFEKNFEIPVYITIR